jgi:hypothetical protein
MIPLHTDRHSQALRNSVALYPGRLSVAHGSIIYSQSLFRTYVLRIVKEGLTVSSEHTTLADYISTIISPILPAIIRARSTHARGHSAPIRFSIEVDLVDLLVAIPAAGMRAQRRVQLSLVLTRLILLELLSPAS